MDNPFANIRGPEDARAALADYLLIFDGGAYRTDPADFAAGIESEFPTGLVRRPLPDPEETVLTNTSYSFTSVIPNDATEAEISELIE